MQTAALVLNIILSIAFIPSLILLYVSFFTFDQGVNAEKKFFFVAMFGLPILLFICLIISWIAYYNGNYSLAFKVNLIPIADVLLLAFFFLKPYLKG